MTSAAIPLDGDVQAHKAAEHIADAAGDRDLVSGQLRAVSGKIDKNEGRLGILDDLDGEWIAGLITIDVANKKPIELIGDERNIDTEGAVAIGNG